MQARGARGGGPRLPREERETAGTPRGGSGRGARGGAGLEVGRPERGGAGAERLGRAGQRSERRRKGAAGGLGVRGASGRAERLWLLHVPDSAFSEIRRGGWQGGKGGRTSLNRPGNWRSVGLANWGAAQHPLPSPRSGIFRESARLVLQFPLIQAPPCRLTRPPFLRSLSWLFQGIG